MLQAVPDAYISTSTTVQVNLWGWQVLPRPQQGCWVGSVSYQQVCGPWQRPIQVKRVMTTLHAVWAVLETAGHPDDF